MAGKTRSVSLKAVLFADLAGYSRLVSRDEEAAVEFVEKCFQIFRTQAAGFGGQIIKTMGDGVLAVFDASSQAVRYAVAVQKLIEELQSEAFGKARFRIGIHMGEVEIVGSDVYGHAVNIAARLVTLAEPGGICVSHEVYRQVRRTTSYAFIAGGLTSLKNIPEPVSIFHFAGESVQASPGERASIRTIGGLSVATAEGDIIALPAGRVRALLGYLALAEHSHELDDRIAALLWPGHDIKAARRSLTHCIRIARAALEKAASNIMPRERGRVGLNSALIEVDLPRLARDLKLGGIADILIERPDWPEVILLGTDEVSPLFQSWLAVTRHNWRAKVADALETCLNRFEPVEPAARRAASALLALEPSHEPAARKLIQHHAANNNAALAIKTYRDFAARLDEQFHLLPSADTVTLMESITRGRARLAWAPKPGPPRLPRVALGTFDASYSGGNIDYLIAGFRSELLVNLSRFREWVVLEAEEGGSKGGAQADYIVSARGRIEDARLSLFITLSEPATGRVIWSEEFPVTNNNWFASQRLLIRKIAAHLHIYLSSDRLRRAISQKDASDFDHSEWLRGQHLLSEWNARAEDEAALIFEGIIRRRPEFAPAYASLAGIYNVRHLIRPGSPLDAEKERRGLELGQRAVALDALDSQNHLTLAWSLAMAGAYEQAAAHYDLAASLNPSSPSLLVSCAQGMAFAGSPERASELLSDARALAPFFLRHQWCYVASTLALTGGYEDAVTASQRGEDATLDTPGWRAVCLAHLGRIDEAKAAFREQVKLVRPLWAGHTEPTDDAVGHWFLSAFPIGRDSDRRKLREAFDLLAKPRPA